MAQGSGARVDALDATEGRATQASRHGEASGDALLEAVIRARFDALMETWPTHATYLGIHRHDGRLADLSRAAKEADIAAEAAFLAELESTDPARLTEPLRFERDVALHGARLRLFDAEVIRGWRRHASASRERLRAAEQARLGDAFSLKGFHDALLYSGSLPVSLHGRLLAGEGGGPTLPPPVSER